MWSPLIGADLSSEQGGIAELMVSGVDTSTCCFVAHKISLTCTSRVFLQLCGRLPRGRWTGGTGGWHGPGLQIEFHALVKNQNVTHKRKKSWRQYQKEFILLSLRVDYKLIWYNYFLSENLPPPSIPHTTVDLRLYLFTRLLAWLPIEIRSPETPPFYVINPTIHNYPKFHPFLGDPQKHPCAMSKPTWTP